MGAIGRGGIRFPPVDGCSSGGNVPRNPEPAGRWHGYVSSFGVVDHIGTPYSHFSSVSNTGSRLNVEPRDGSWSGPAVAPGGTPMPEVGDLHSHDSSSQVTRLVAF